jgi:hypothetical protein
METWQDRVVAEAKELAGKLDKLEEFLRTPKDISTAEWRRLKQQADAMGLYLTILQARIANF